jgi:4-amino-4-deoxy-L-arabinose transferase-like glycosyltransferase
VNQPNPAIVAQAAVRRLPRGALLFFCLAYLLPGFIGRDAWKSADISTLGFVAELAQGSASWLHPTLLGLSAENPSVLPYWLGAWAMQWGPHWIAADFLVRIPFAMLLALGLAGTWYGTYYLARSPRAQPVAFAFGGEARPKDYARAMADGALLALIACLGLAQLGHETTPALAQLGFSGLLFFALATLHYRTRASVLAAWIGVLGLGLCGAPTLALLFLGGGVLIHVLDRNTEAQKFEQDPHKALTVTLLLASTVACAWLCLRMDLWRWKVELPQASWTELNGALQLLIWFTWPAWPLALWTVWRWRRQLFSRTFSRHLALPVWFVLVTLGSTFTTGSPDRTLLLGLPAMAALAAFALPTLKRQVAALIDWFTLIFFSSCGFTIWVVWIAMQTGYPSQPAANVERLAPGFVPHFSTLAFAAAIAATLVWAWLVQWRVGRHRAAIWKSLVLPAGGAALCWMLLMTLWMPLLNYTQSYNAMVGHTLERMDPAGCVETLGLSSAKTAAFQVYGKLQLKPMQDKASCPWLIAEPGDDMSAPHRVDNTQWDLLAQLHHPADGNESVLVFRRR